MMDREIANIQSLKEMSDQASEKHGGWELNCVFLSDRSHSQKATDCMSPAI